jgi:GTP1/Obg family GTP-binding protein
MSTALDQSKRRVEMSSEIFGAALRDFVRRWAPEDRRDVHDFHTDLTRLMVEAMRHKSDCLGYGISHYAETTFAEMSLRPLRVIVEEQKR